MIQIPLNRDLLNSFILRVKSDRQLQKRLVLAVSAIILVFSSIVMLNTYRTIKIEKHLISALRTDNFNALRIKKTLFGFELVEPNSNDYLSNGILLNECFNGDNNGDECKDLNPSKPLYYDGKIILSIQRAVEGKAVNDVFYETPENNLEYFMNLSSNMVQNKLYKDNSVSENNNNNN